MTPTPRSTNKSRATGAAARSTSRGFTLVELLVVMAIIAILFSAIFVASSAVLVRARGNATTAVLQVAAEAMEEFKREQQAHPTISKASRMTTDGVTYRYRDRFGEYPPDELEVFTEVGLPSWGTPPTTPPHGFSLAPGGALIAPHTLSPKSTAWSAMRFYGKPSSPNENVLEHRDIAAMVLAIDLFGDASKAILDKIPARNWKNAPLDALGKEPMIWLDRPLRPGSLPDNRFGQEDLQLRYLIDDWGIPLSYFAQRDWIVGEPQAQTTARASSNHAWWRQASSTFIRLNGGLPVVMSYGPDGRDQLQEEPMTTRPTGQAAEGDSVASLVGDFAAYPDNSPDRRINHPMNADNLYVNPELREKLAQGP